MLPSPPGKSPHPREKKPTSQSQGQTRFAVPWLQAKHRSPAQWGSWCRLSVAGPSGGPVGTPPCTRRRCTAALPAGHRGASPAPQPSWRGATSCGARLPGQGQRPRARTGSTSAFPTAAAAGCVMGNYLGKQWPLPPFRPARARPCSVTLRLSLCNPHSRAGHHLRAWGRPAAWVAASSSPRTGDGCHHHHGTCSSRELEHSVPGKFPAVREAD